MSSPLKKITRFKAKLIVNSIAYPGIIENLSKDSLYIRTASGNSKPDFTPGKVLRVNFNADSDKEISLFGVIRWSYKTPPYGITDSLGIEITGSRSHYEEFFNAL
jgi:hypothetical protein